MQARMVLEPSVAVLAAHAATQADLARIASFADQGGRSEDFDSFETWDSKFHRAIGEALAGRRRSHLVLVTGDEEQGEVSRQGARLGRIGERLTVAGIALRVLAHDQLAYEGGYLGL